MYMRIYLYDKYIIYLQTTRLIAHSIIVIISGESFYHLINIYFREEDKSQLYPRQYEYKRKIYLKYMCILY